MSRFTFTKTPLPGAVIVHRKKVEDNRGFFSRFYCEDEFRDAGYELPLAQVNHSLTRRKGAVRGLHFQYPPHSEIKLVICLKGEVFDVALDLRAGSPTFLKWHGEFLSQDNAKGFYIPKGFAHGFQTLTDECELLYLNSSAFAPKAEGGVSAQDQALAIPWPLDISELSVRDSSHPLIDASFTGIAL